jgi:pentatricopeptide repeat protein
MLQRFKNKEQMVVAMLVEPEFRFQNRTLSTAFVQTQAVTDTNSHEHLIKFSKQGRLEESCRYYVFLLQDCIKKKALAEAKLIHARINQSGCMADLLLHNTLLNAYAKCGAMVYARRVFDQMPKRDVCSWTVMIAAYARRGTGEEAFSLFHQMQRTGFQPNHFTFSSVLPACVHLASLEQGMEIHREIIRMGFESHLVVANALLDMYAKCGRMENAREVFDRICQRDIVSWNTMIAGYAWNGLLDEALKLFQQMPQRDAFSWTSMIAGFSQNGLVGEALKFFKEMPQRTAVSWNAMLTGLAHNGFVDDALKTLQGNASKNRGLMECNDCRFCTEWVW